jgi:hypothetical protein
MKEFPAKIFLILALCICTSISSYAQCSDAGVCMIAANDRDTLLNFKSNITLGFDYGRSGLPEDVSTSAFYLGGTIGAGKFGLSFNIPYSYQSVNASVYSGPGDLTLLLNYNTPLNKNSSLTLIAGTKLATGNSNIGDTLPLILQSSLGTNDIIAGINYRLRNLSFSLGGQIPLTVSKNNATHMKRGSDLLISTAYSHISENYSLTGSLLAIKRLNRSKINDIEVIDSDFFQLNVMGSVELKLAKALSTEIIIAIPLLSRKENSDGTKRSFTVSSSISYFFNL